MNNTIKNWFWYISEIYKHTRKSPFSKLGIKSYFYAHVKKPFIIMVGLKFKADCFNINWLRLQENKRSKSNETDCSNNSLFSYSTITKTCCGQLCVTSARKHFSLTFLIIQKLFHQS